MKISLLRFTQVTLVSIYLVMLAGALVRMSGSGMGCPDWPKCFGYYIPPTQIEQLQWQTQRSYEADQMIIKDERLWSAKMSFVSGPAFEERNWAIYEKHSYAQFNVKHTYTEYINRLVGALSGLFTLALAIWVSLKFWSKDWKMPALAWSVVLLMGFEAWLGALVVYSELEPVKITIHMIMALVILALLVIMIFKQQKEIQIETLASKTTTFMLLIMAMTVLQLILGTQVRQFIDNQVAFHGLDQRSLWLSEPEFIFYFHRSFTIALTLLVLWVWWINRSTPKLNRLLLLQVGIIALEIITGVAMIYIDFPLGTQPIHLIMASVLLGLQLYIGLLIHYRYHAKSETLVKNYNKDVVL